jgi:hypothetical protein
VDNRAILPPGQQPIDPSGGDIDPVAHELERLQTYLVWIDEHRSSFVKLRNCDPVCADTELLYLKDATEHALAHLLRLMELFVAGYTNDPNKGIPEGQVQPDWLRAYLGRLRGGGR